MKWGVFLLAGASAFADIGTLNSTIEALNRAGDPLQQFDALETRVVKTGDRIELRDGHTANKSIGLTTAGVIDLAGDQAHLRGIVVPGLSLDATPATVRITPSSMSARSAIVHSTIRRSAASTPISGWSLT